MRTSNKRQDNINVRVGYSTKSDLTALAQVYEMSVAEYVRYLIREAIEENYDKIKERQMMGVSKDTSADDGKN